MPTAGSKAHEQYTVRQKIFRLLGNTFHVFDAEGNVVGYCKQKAFRLREDIRFYTDESPSEELFAMRARSIMDFSTTYDIQLPDGQSLGSLRRKGFSSMLRDSWRVFDPKGDQIGRVIEDSAGLALLRRIVGAAAVFVPQKFLVQRGDDRGGETVAVFRTHFNPFVYRLGVSIVADDDRFDDLLVLAAACLIAAIEGRQSGGGSGDALFSGD